MLLIAHYYFSIYAGSMSYFIVMGSDSMLFVFLVLTSCIRACRAWYEESYHARHARTDTQGKRGEVNKK